MSAGAAEPTPEERLWAADPTTPPTVLAKLARFAELRPLIREHPSVYPDLVAWIDAQVDGDAADTPPVAASRRPLWIAAGIAALTIVAAGVTLGVTQPWASSGGAVAAAAPEEAVDGTPTPALTATPTLTPTPEPEPAVPVPGTVVVPAGANLRAGPSTSAEKIGAYSHNATVEIACYVRGDTVSDALGTTDVWFAVGNGYISAAILQPSDPSAVVPCA
jgi:hypothetical protein